MKRLRRLAIRFTAYIKVNPVRVFVLKNKHDPTGDVMGMFMRSRRAIFIRTRSSYRRKVKKRFTWKYLRGILTHELAHLPELGGMYHAGRHRKAMRRVGRLLTKLDRE